VQTIFSDLTIISPLDYNRLRWFWDERGDNLKILIKCAITLSRFSQHHNNNHEIAK
jgi:hypothetical protein